jgi:hypothetical protein
MSDDKQLDMDQLDAVAGGSAIDAINQIVSETKPRQGDSLQAPYGAAPLQNQMVNPGVISPQTPGALKKDF